MWTACVYHSWQHMKAAQCAHMLQAACLFGPPLSIHPLLFIPSLHVSVSQQEVQYMVWLTVTDALWGTSSMKIWSMNHRPQDENTAATAAFAFLPTVFPLFLTPSISVFHFSCVPLAHLVGLVVASSKRPWCVQTLVTVGEERSRITILKSWLFVWFNGRWQSISS